MVHLKAIILPINVHFFQLSEKNLITSTSVSNSFSMTSAISSLLLGMRLHSMSVGSNRCTFQSVDTWKISAHCRAVCSTLCPAVGRSLSHKNIDPTDHRQYNVTLQSQTYVSLIIKIYNHEFHKSHHTDPTSVGRWREEWFQTLS